jgi:hypothetical protein
MHNSVLLKQKDEIPDYPYYRKFPHRAENTIIREKVALNHPHSDHISIFGNVLPCLPK